MQSTLSRSSTAKQSGELSIQLFCSLGFQLPKKYLATVECQSGRNFETIRVDGGEECVNTEFSNFLKSHSISHRTTCADQPQHNGTAESLNWTTLEMVRSMMSHKRVGKEF